MIKFLNNKYEILSVSTADKVLILTKDEQILESMYLTKSIEFEVIMDESQEVGGSSVLDYELFINESSMDDITYITVPEDRDDPDFNSEVYFVINKEIADNKIKGSAILASVDELSKNPIVTDLISDSTKWTGEVGLVDYVQNYIPSDWTISNESDIEPPKLTDETMPRFNGSVLDFLSMIAKEYDFEFIPKIYLEDGNIRKEIVFKKEIINPNNYHRLTKGDLATSVVKKLDSTKLYTAIYPLGNYVEIEKGDNSYDPDRIYGYEDLEAKSLDGDNKYSYRLNVKALELSKENGDPINKKVGSPYITIFNPGDLEFETNAVSFYDEFGNLAQKHRVLVQTFNEDDEHRLAMRAYEYLIGMNKPDVSFKVEAPLANVKIGDIAAIIDTKPGINTTNRIYKITTNYLNGLTTNIEAGRKPKQFMVDVDKRLNSAEKRIEKLERTAKNVKRTAYEEWIDDRVTNGRGHNYSDRSGNVSIGRRFGSDVSNSLVIDEKLPYTYIRDIYKSYPFDINYGSEFVLDENGEWIYGEDGKPVMQNKKVKWSKELLNDLPGFKIVDKFYFRKDGMYVVPIDYNKPDYKPELEGDDLGMDYKSENFHNIVKDLPSKFMIVCMQITNKSTIDSIMGFNYRLLNPNRFDDMRKSMHEVDKKIHTDGRYKPRLNPIEDPVNLWPVFAFGINDQSYPDIAIPSEGVQYDRYTNGDRFLDYDFRIKWKSVNYSDKVYSDGILKDSGDLDP